MKFTDKYIGNLKQQEKMYQVREGQGFGIRVLPSGHKIWIFTYTFAGKRRQMNLGNYPDITLAKARKRLIDARGSLNDGKDPQEIGFEWHKNPEREKQEAKDKEEIDKKNPSVKVLADEYMKRYAKVVKRESSWKEDERMLNKDVLPAWGDRKANEIRKRDCVLFLESFMDRPALCNNIMKLVRKMFNFAVERDILEFTPFSGVKVPVHITHRTRTLTETEIKALWNDELPKAAICNEIKCILKLILATGQRPGEVCGIHTREIDGNWWTIPMERSKNKTEHRVYLTATALEILGEADGYYFPTYKESDEGEGHIREKSISFAIRRNLKDYKGVRKLGELVKMSDAPEERKMVMEHFTPHDLRRTCATFLSKIGFSDEVIDSVLGHKKQGIVKVYNQYKYDAEKQKALEAWELKLHSIITGKKAKVIPMKRAES